MIIGCPKEIKPQEFRVGGAPAARGGAAPPPNHSAGPPLAGPNAATAGAQQSVGKNMPTFGINAQLRFIERHKGDVPVGRHGFRGAQQPAGVGREDARKYGYTAPEAGRTMTSVATWADSCVTPGLRQSDREKHGRLREGGVMCLIRKENLVGRARLERATNGLKVRCSTD